LPSSSTSSSSSPTPVAHAGGCVRPTNVTGRSIVTRTPAPPPVPTHGAYFGAFALKGEATQDNLVKSFQALAAAACRPLDLAHVYLRWNRRFPTPAITTLVSDGAYPLVSWTGTDTRVINSGAVDSSITATAHQIASLHSPVFLEFRWEMDRPNLARVVHSGPDYVAAWDRVHRLFAAAGVRNVSWVWCPTAAGFADHRVDSYYPGNNEVDWVCSDAYPGSDFGPASYQPLNRLLQPFLDWAKQQEKPAMLGEFGVPRSYSSKERSMWLEDARASLTASSQVKAVAYFDYDPVGVASDRQYALGQSRLVRTAFRSLATDPYFTLFGRS
jgi:hypothetical protein